MQTESIIAILLVGLAGAPHCAGMCGGIAAALNFSLPEQNQHGSRLLYWQLLFSLGRITSYSLIGFLAGLIGEQLLGLFPRSAGHAIAGSVTAAMILLVALQVAGFSKVSWMEQAGQQIWKHIQPLTKALVPVNHPVKALLIGFLWGWIPCGLVYSALAIAIGSGSSTSALVLMFLFGLATTPAIATSALVVGSGLGKLKQHRRLLALILVILAILVLWNSFYRHQGHTMQAGHNMLNSPAAGHSHHP